MVLRFRQLEEGRSVTFLADAKPPNTVAGQIGLSPVDDLLEVLQ